MKAFRHAVMKLDAEYIFIMALGLCLGTVVGHWLEAPLYARIAIGMLSYYIVRAGLRC